MGADLQGILAQLHRRITYGWTSVQYRVKAYDAAGAESAYTTSATRTVTNNRPPVISGTDGALGSFSTAARPTSTPSPTPTAIRSTSWRCWTASRCAATP